MKSNILCDSNVLINDTCQYKVITCIVYTQICNWILFHVLKCLSSLYRFLMVMVIFIHQQNLILKLTSKVIIQ